MRMADESSGEDGGGRNQLYRCGTTGIVVTEIREGGYDSGGDTVHQQKICGATEMAFW